MAAETSNEDVANAFRAAMKPAEEDEAPPQQDTAEVDEVPEEVEAEPALAAGEEATAEAPAVEQDDVTSLKARLAEREAETTRYKEQLEAVVSRNKQSLESLNGRAMRFASQRDRARQLLEKAMSPDGVDKSEAERLLADIRGGYNPASANYEPPPQQYYEQPPQQASLSEDQTIATNEFFNDHRFTAADVESFGEWARSKAVLTPRERALAQTDMYSFLSLLEPRFRAEVAAKATATDNTRAVKTVARVQKQAAKAVSASIGSPNVGNSPSTPKQPPKLTDEQLGAAFRQSWEESR